MLTEKQKAVLELLGWEILTANNEFDMEMSHTLPSGDAFEVYLGTDDVTQRLEDWFYDDFDPVEYIQDTLNAWKKAGRPADYELARDDANAASHALSNAIQQLLSLKMDPEQVSIYTDGACSGNPGPGGWATIVLNLDGGYSESITSGSDPNTTNNRMELTAVIRGLELLNRPCHVDLYSDSRYVVDALKLGWAESWKRKGWRKADRKPALNPDLWDRLLKLCVIHDVNPIWVKGHSDNVYNCRCDELARRAAEFASSVSENDVEEADDAYTVYVRVTGRVPVVVEAKKAKTKAEAAEIAEAAVGEMEFGPLEDIDWETSRVAGPDEI